MLAVCGHPELLGDFNDQPQSAHQASCLVTTHLVSLFPLDFCHSATYIERTGADGLIRVKAVARVWVNGKQVNRVKTFYHKDGKDYKERAEAWAHINNRREAMLPLLWFQFSYVSSHREI